MRHLCDDDEEVIVENVIVEDIKMINFSVPVYYTQTFKAKNDKTFLVSLNWYRNACYYQQNKIKHYYHELVKDQLKGLGFNLPRQYRVKYTYHYKNKSSDMMNVGALIDKFVQDGLQESNIVKDDNVQFYTRSVFEVGNQDKFNPRIDVLIEERLIA